MNRTEFLSELDKALTGMSVEEKKDILSDYVEHFRLGKSEGKSEEEICAALGSPRQIAKAYRADSLVDTASGNPSAGNIFRAVLAVVSLSFFNLVVVLGPFLGLLGALLGVWVAGIAITLSGIGVFFAALFSPIFPQLLPGLSFQGLLGSAFLGLGLGSLGLLACIGLYYVTVFFYRMLVAYLKFNLKIIRGQELVK